MPAWIKDCKEKGTSESYQLTIIRKQLMHTFYYDDADIPLTNSLLKMIRKRAWTRKDGNISRPSLVNAMEGLSPFAMVDMDKDMVARYNDEDELLDAASLVSVEELRALKKKRTLTIPEEAAEFLVILKRFANLLFALFTSACPLFKCMKEIITALRDYSREARRRMSLNTKGALLWIVLLQARQFSLGEANILYEFTKMHEDLRAKKSCIHHGEMPLELLTNIDDGERGGLSRFGGGGEDPPSRKNSRQKPVFRIQIIGTIS